MKTLIVHPEDPSTVFLKPVYESVPDRTLITGGVTQAELSSLIESHDRIMMLGHGSPFGLLSVGCFPGAGLHIIDNPIAKLLRGKKNNVLIWCNADQYVNRHCLEGFFSGMFVSEEIEALLMDIDGFDESMIDESNRLFGPVAGRYINQDPKSICNNVRRDYGSLAARNPVIAYNVRRLYYKIGNHNK